MDIRDAIGVSFSWSQFVKRNGEAGLYLEAEPEVSGLKDTGYRAVYPSAFLGKRLWGGRNPGEDPASKDPTGVWKNAGAVSKEETYRTSESCIFPICIGWGYFQQKPKRIPYAVRSDIRRLDLRIRQMEFLQKEEINTREELAAYRKPLEEQVLSLMKERENAIPERTGRYADSGDQRGIKRTSKEDPFEPADREPVERDGRAVKTGKGTGAGYRNMSGKQRREDRTESVRR